VESVR